jgi:hypothetical protein
MKTTRIQRRVASFVSAILFLLPISPALAGGEHKGRPELSQGSRYPGLAVLSKETARPVEVTFTKWAVPGSTTPYSLLAGFTGGDIVGVYVGEVLHRVASQAQPEHNRIVWLEAMYEVQAGDHSFTALIRGGTDMVTGAALLDGVILAGWRTGARVHVEFRTYAPLPTGPGCPDTRAPTDRNCFMGTIHVERASED